MQERLKKQERYRRLLTLGGVVVTVGYWALIFNWSGRHGWDLSKLSAQDAGTFLSGVFAPVAFLWLVIGFNLQSAELKQNSESLALQAAEMRESVQAQSRQADEFGLHGKYFRQDVLNKTREQFETELGVMAVNFVKDGIIIEDNGIYMGQSSWSKFSAGDREVFVRMAARCVNADFENADKIYHDEGWCNPEFNDVGYIELYLNHFDYFISTLDTFGDEATARIYRQRSFGQLYDALMKQRLLLQQVAD